MRITERTPRERRKNMGLVAVIRREPRLSEAEWLACIARTPELVHEEPREAINPFTQARYLKVPRATDVGIESPRDSSVLGGIYCEADFETDGELSVYAPYSEEYPDEEGHMSAEGRAIVDRIALSMGAQVDWFW